MAAHAGVAQAPAGWMAASSERLRCRPASGAGRVVTTLQRLAIAPQDGTISSTATSVAPCASHLDTCRDRVTRACRRAAGRSAPRDVGGGIAACLRAAAAVPSRPRRQRMRRSRQPRVGASPWWRMGCDAGSTGRLGTILDRIGRTSPAAVHYEAAGQQAVADRQSAARRPRRPLTSWRCRTSAPGRTAWRVRRSRSTNRRQSDGGAACSSDRSRLRSATAPPRTRRRPVRLPARSRAEPTARRTAPHKPAKSPAMRLDQSTAMVQRGKLGRLSRCSDRAPLPRDTKS